MWSNAVVRVARAGSAVRFALVAAALLATVAVPVSAQGPPGAAPQQTSPVSEPGAAGASGAGGAGAVGAGVSGAGGAGAVGAAPVLGGGFAAGGRWVVPGTVSLDWDGVAGASGYEVMWRGEDGWALLSGRGLVGGAAIEFDGSSAVVGGLPEHLGEYWFAVRARNAWGMSEWSGSFSVAVPGFAVTPEDVEAVFDPFTAPTSSGIDLERLGQAAMSITPGQADCENAPALDVAGVTMVDAPAGLGDPDTELSVAEVVRIAGGCLLVEYADLAGRSVADIRDLLSSEATVFAVSEPVRGFVPDHDSSGSDDDTAHYDDTNPHRPPSGSCCEQWHLTQDITGKGLDPATDTWLWQGWVGANPVVVAVLDTGVDVRHFDLVNRLAPNRAGGCHGVDGHGHGTHVAGIVAAEAGNGVHVAGVAPKARILPVSVAMKGNTCVNANAGLAPLSAPAAVAEAVNRGARVINMSFSGSARRNTSGLVAGGVEVPAANTYEAVLRTASMLGAVAVAAAGNCGDDRDGDGDGSPNWEEGGCDAHNAERLPAAFSRTFELVGAAEPVLVDSDVIAVASVSHDGTRSSFSTANDNVVVAAPGGDLNDNRRPIPGESILSTGLCERSGAPSSPLVCATAEKNGTSMAAPFVSGVVAHMLNRYPQATVGQVRKALVESARDAGSTGRDDEFGYGVVDPSGAVNRLGEIIDRGRVLGPSGYGFVSVVAGGRFSCGVFANGAVRCWGDEELADAVPLTQEFSQVSVPVGVLGYGCGLRPLGPGDGRGTVLCWSGAGSRVLEFVPQGAFTALAAGRTRTCGLRPSGEAVCWENMTGERVGGVPEGEFTQVSGGWDHWCGLRENGTAVCWGDGAGGRAAAAAGEFSDVSAGGLHTCAVRRSDGGVVCWGAPGAAAGVPAVGGGLGFYRISAGYGHSCALEQVSESGVLTSAFGGEVVCWGDNSWGQTDAPAGRFVQVSAGWRHTCGLRWTGRVECWGDGSFGQGSSAALGGLSLTASSGPVPMSPGFDPDVLAYGAEAPRGAGAIAAVGAADSDVVEVSPGDADAAVGGHQVVLENGAVIEVEVRSLWGYGQERVYRIHVAELPRLGSLRLYGPGFSAACLIADSCAEAALDPAFDAETGEYEAVAPAHWNQITVVHTATGGTASTAPADADPDTPGHQVALSTDRGYTAVSSGRRHSCGIKTDRSVACWGDSSFGQSVAPPGEFAAVSAGGSHSCGIKTDRSVACWGYSFYGQSDAPAGRFTVVSAGRRHTCGIKTDRSVACWGYNQSGQSDAPAGAFVEVSAGFRHSCGIKTDRSVACWGSNSSRQSDAPAGSFVSVSAGGSHSCGIKTDRSVACWGLRDSRIAAPAGSFAAVSAGFWHSCGVMDDGAAVCWGGNYAGEAVSPAGSFASVSAGSGFSCGVKAGGAAVCWGQDAWGQQAAPAGRFSAVAAGAFHSCGIGSGGGAVCWGGDDNGQSGAPAGRFAAVSAGGFHSCGIKADQSVACWGSNSWRQSAAPAGRFAAVSVGWVHSCGIKADQSVACWGSNSSGRADAPAGKFAAVSAGSRHTCGIKTDRSVACWGSNSNGESDAPAGAFISVSAGDSFSCGVKAGGAVVCWGASASSAVRPVPSGSFASVSAGRYHTCAIRADRSVACWGWNIYGQLDAPSGSFASVSAGNYHTCAIRAADSAAVCWGARPRELEPARPQTVVVAVRGEVPAAAAGLGVGAASAIYVVSVGRPRPPRPQLRSAAEGALITGTEAGTPEAGDDEQQRRLEQQILDERRLHEQQILEQQRLEEQAPARPKGHIPQPRVYPLPAQPSDSAGGGSGGSQQTGPADGAVGPGGAPACPQAPGGSEIVAIGDPVLRAAVEGALGKASGEAVTAAELGTVSELVVPAGGGRVSSLAGLEHAAGLRVLGLWGHDVADLGPLGCLERLSALGLGGNRIADLGPLAKLTGLASLGLGGNRIADVSPLSGLSGLKRLYLHDNQIADISTLGGLTGLNTLDVSFNQIADIAALRGLGGLASLGIGGNRVADLSPLSGLSGLRSLYVFDNEVADVSPLSGLSSLETLWADGNRVAGTAVLAGLSALGYLDARHNLISDTGPLDALDATVHSQPQNVGLIGDAALLAAVQAALGLQPHQQPTAEQLAGLRALKRAGPRHDPDPVRSLKGLEHATGLHTLEMPSNHITDLAPIAGLTGLRKLDLQNNQITNLSPLAGLGSLRHLNLILNNIADISTLPPLGQLETLFLDINQITDLEPLRGRTQLTRLSLSSNQIANLQPLKNLDGLNRLNLSHNRITGLQPLTGLTNLTVLRLTQNQITNLQPLTGLHQITELRLAHNKITNIEPIATLPRLWFLDIGHNQITDTTPLNGHPTLQHLYT